MLASIQKILAAILFILLATHVGALPIEARTAGKDWEVYPRILHDYLVRERALGATMVLLRGDVPVVEAAIGYQDAFGASRMKPETMLGLASNDKPVTQAAIATLIRRGWKHPRSGAPVTMDTPIYPLLVAYGVPMIGAADFRIQDITIKHLKDHRSGLEDFKSIDQMRKAIPFEGRWTAAQTAVYVFSRPLRNKPGSVESYSNVSYDLLRLLIQLETGDLVGFLRSEVFVPAGAAEVALYNDDQVHLTLAASAMATARIARRHRLFGGDLLVDPDSGLRRNSDNGFWVMHGAWSGTRTYVSQDFHLNLVAVILLRYEPMRGDPKGDPLDIILRHHGSQRPVAPSPHRVRRLGLSPSTPIAGESLRIIYDSRPMGLAQGAQVYLHVGRNGWKDLSPKGRRMQRFNAPGTYAIPITVPPATETLDFWFSTSAEADRSKGLADLNGQDGWRVRTGATP